MSNLPLKSDHPRGIFSRVYQPREKYLILEIFKNIMSQNVVQRQCFNDNVSGEMIYYRALVDVLCGDPFLMGQQPTARYAVQYETPLLRSSSGINTMLQIKRVYDDGEVEDFCYLVGRDDGNLFDDLEDSVPDRNSILYLMEKMLTEGMWMPLAQDIRSLKGPHATRQFGLDIHNKSLSEE